ncbi:MAG: hypothetical protein AAGC54_14890 [Cyanobacteria bacterium P01_F01_bin.4]
MPSPKSPSPRRRRQYQSSSLMPWPAIATSVLFYALAGLLLGAVSPPFWVWPLAMGGTLMQALSLTGPQSLAELTRPQIRRVGVLARLGSLLLVVALAISANFANTNDFDSIKLGSTAWTVLGASLMAIILTALCTTVAMQTGDRLVALFGRSRSGLMLAGVCFLGLFLGGLIGLAISTL